MQPNLSELLSSRICHDLISPVGAIGNGLELMNELGNPSPELELVGQSAQTAQAKLKFFRTAFGDARHGQIGGPEAQRTAEAMFASGRIKVTFSEPWGDRQRGLVKLLYLLLLCVESSLPRGGNMQCTPTISGWKIEVKNTPIKVQEELWSHVTSGTKVSELTAKTIQFNLARQLCVDQSIALDLTIGESQLTLRF